jgi:endonuclease III
MSLNAQIAPLLLANRGEGTDWGEYASPDHKPWSQKFANEFLLCSLLDYQIPSSKAWANGYRLIKEILGDPDDVWKSITSASEDEWASRRAEYNLHRFPAAHNRLWRIGKRICGRYDGDARRIWINRDPQSVLQTLWDIGAGDQISRMIVGALRDCGEIKADASDVKGDIYVRRVLGRALTGDIVDAETAVKLARELHPADPWQLDAQLWQIGSAYCTAKHPKCGGCYLAPHCIYAASRR